MSSNGRLLADIMTMRKLLKCNIPQYETRTIAVGSVNVSHERECRSNINNALQVTDMVIKGSLWR